MPSVGFESTISAGERPRTYALERAATGTGFFYDIMWKKYFTAVHVTVYNVANTH